MLYPKIGKVTENMSELRSSAQESKYDWLTRKRTKYDWLTHQVAASGAVSCEVEQTVWLQIALT